MRRALLLVNAVLVLALVNGSILAKERLLAGGRVLLLELTAWENRSLVQGDYVALRYATLEKLPAAMPERSGRLVLALDARGVGRFVRVDGGEPLGAGEVAVQYRISRANAWSGTPAVRIGPESYFFEEGQGAAHGKARYGELRVAGDGGCLLVGLRDVEFEPLGTGAVGR
ncbi:MAG: GDYXXLXY domain-containing protein [Planctomycetes bacterium]|nr:GDYXXLXY domain-containing protein [Planctomycetota bacterium]